jgi:hypothetical protein
MYKIKQKQTKHIYGDIKAITALTENNAQNRLVE